MWLLPSRRRITNLQRFFAAYKATGGRSPGMVLVDVADYSDNRAAYDAMDLPIGWFFHFTQGETQGEKVAEVWDTVKDCFWLGLIGDDCVPETPDWDHKLVERLTGGNFVSCNDGWLAPNRVANCWIMSGPLVRAIGYIFPPGLHHLFIDDVWETVGREAGCWTLAMDVMVRHRHVLQGDAPADDTHVKAYGAGFTAVHPGPDRASGLWAGDELVYQDWLQEERHIAVDAARRVAEQYPQPEAKDPAEHHPKHHPMSHPGYDEETLAYLRSRKVMILTPTLYRPAWQYTDSMMFTIRDLERLGIEWSRARVLGMSNLPLARCILTAHFLTHFTSDGSHYTDAFMIDDDMEWHPRAVIDLLASRQPLIGAAGRKKNPKPNTDPGVWCFYVPPDVEIEWDTTGAFSTAHTKVGGAFMRIHRSVFEAMAEAHSDWKRPPLDDTQDLSPEVQANLYNFFRNDPAGRSGGEDFAFCDSWNEMGGKVWVNPSIVLGHVGEMNYKGSLAEIMLQAPPTSA